MEELHRAGMRSAGHQARGMSFAIGPGTESHTVSVMIRMYCRAKHRQPSLCDSCQSLTDYALKRIGYCIFGNEKPVCSDCPVHCYKPDYRERIREVMRFAGPRMIWQHPVLAIRHIIKKKKGKSLSPSRSGNKKYAL
jgi:hypothetical protein